MPALAGRWSIVRAIFHYACQLAHPPTATVTLTVPRRKSDKVRWERIVMRHPALALPRLRSLMKRASSSPAQVRAALQASFFILERWGRAAELQEELQAALQQTRSQRALPEAAELSEALGRLHYQRGDYAQACDAWSLTLDWATDDSRSACLARVGLAHLCFALGDWARGGRVLDQAELHYPQLAHEPYLRAKIALNRAVSLRTTQGPQAALGALDEALSAAREAGHRDYQAEAIWQHARCARDSGDTALALTLGAQAQALAQRCGYRWLQANAALLLSELSGGEAALSWVRQALALAEAIQSRSTEAAAHSRLAELMRERGELGPGWHHQTQAQRLEALLLKQGPVPARLEALARFDTDPTGADTLLLSLATQAWTLERPDDFQRAWLKLRPRLIEGLGLLDVQLWWDADASGGFQRLSSGREAKKQLSAAAMPGYLDALSRPGEPLICSDPAQHPWRAEIGVAQARAGGASRLELGLHDDKNRGGRLVALLWLTREPGAPWPRADISRAGRLAALLERMLGGLDPARPPDGQAALDLAALAASVARLSALLQDQPLSRDALNGLAVQLAAQVRQLEQRFEQQLEQQLRPAADAGRGLAMLKP